MRVPWWTEFSWLTIEVRAFIDLLWLGQKHHLALCNASQPPAAPINSRLLGEDKVHHLFTSLVFVLNLLEHDKRGPKLILCLDLLLWQVLPQLSGARFHSVCAGEQETQQRCHGSEERGRSTAPQNLAGFLEPARGGGESPWDIILTISPSVCVWMCVCASEGATRSCKCTTRVFYARVCMCCVGSMLDVGTELRSVMATYRGRPSVWYSAALWGLIAVTSSGTGCTLSQGLHQVASQLWKNEIIKGSFYLLHPQRTLLSILLHQPAVNEPSVQYTVGKPDLCSLLLISSWSYSEFNLSIH